MMPMPLLGPFPYIEIHKTVPLGPGHIVHLSWDKHSDDFTAIIDSGADMTCIPTRLVKLWSLNVTGRRNVKGSTSKIRQTQLVYGINLQCPDLGFNFAYFDVLPIDGLEANEVLIGRDILNRYRIMLDGPKLVFTIE